MDILEQCQAWHKNEEYHKIINALEDIPAQVRTPEQDSELARAYNNLANEATSVDKTMLQRAIDLLKPHRDYFQGDHLWNFRMGYSYFYLDREELALPYFQQALDALPDDEDTLYFISYCHRALALPRFEESFRERTQKAWAAFAAQEAALRQIMDEDEANARGDELIAQCSEILELAFEQIAFEMGFHDGKYELILLPEGSKVTLFQLVYFQHHAPAQVLEHWSILVGHKPAGNMDLRLGDRRISGEDIQVWVEKLDENCVGLTLYCEKLLPELASDENQVWWILTTMADSALGDIPSMNYITQFDVVDTPKDAPSIPLSQLAEALKDMGLDLSITPEIYLERYTGYQMEPNEDLEADRRLDVMVGSTACASIINDYLNDNPYEINKLHANGAVAGFFYYPLNGFAGEDYSQKIFAFRDALEETLLEAGSDVLTLIGGATGLYYGYVDFIAWDLPTALETAKDFFAASSLPWADFQVFRRDVPAVQLWEDPLAELDFIPDTPEHADAFYQQLEQWNNDNEYTRCIQVLDAIPSELQDYRSAYALARALENYAIIGDHEEGTPVREGDKALYRAIHVLEAVQNEGKDLAEWNMRMAYAYQYLQQEERAIPYAQRWAELDPDDKKAVMVIQECREEVKKKEAVRKQPKNMH